MSKIITNHIWCKVHRLSHTVRQTSTSFFVSVIMVKFSSSSPCLRQYKQYVNYLASLVQDWQVSYDIDSIFMIHWSVLRFCSLVGFSDNVINSAIIFYEWNDSQLYMSRVNFISVRQSILSSLRTLWLNLLNKINYLYNTALIQINRIILRK